MEHFDEFVYLKRCSIAFKKKKDEKMTNNKMLFFAFHLLVIVERFLLFNCDYVYDACELANELVQVHGIANAEIADWICLIYTESSFRTAAVGPFSKATKSRDYGLFQINSYYWCKSSDPNESSRFNVCNQNCDNLLDENLADDLECVQEIYSVHGFRAWSGYVEKCVNSTISRKVFKDNCDEVPTIGSKLIQYIHRSKPVDELPQLPDYKAKRDYSPFEFNDHRNRQARKLGKNLEKKFNEITHFDESSTNDYLNEPTIGSASGKLAIRKQLLDDEPPISNFRHTAEKRLKNEIKDKRKQRENVKESGDDRSSIDGPHRNEFAITRPDVAEFGEFGTRQRKHSKRKFNLIKWTTRSDGVLTMTLQTTTSLPIQFTRTQTS